MFSRWLCENNKKGYLYLRPKAKGNPANQWESKVFYTTIVQTALMSIRRKYNRPMLDIGKHHKRGKQWTTLKEIKKRQEYQMM
jgi:hypothetical protein